MEENKSYRIRTVVGTDNPEYVGNLNVNLQQEYDAFEILSLKITSSDTYRLHDSNCGVIAGRVLANNGFGIPNAKISLFIEADSDDAEDLRNLYPYTSTASKNSDGYQYNLLPDSKTDDCHQVVGTFPNKTYLLENDLLLEVFEKYYKFTTRSNNSGDYMMVGVPVGTHTLHMDLDLSDCGILSQRPRDFVYKGYTIEQFESPNQFKTDKNISSLSQIFTQDQVVTVNPFWGNSSEETTIGITRTDINVAYKFEPTCVFMGSVVSDNSSNGISKKCVPTNRMGAMDELISGEGSIEMIRKTPTGAVEVFTIKGNQQIDGNGVWCYQIPMNLDYVVTDEYGNMVPTDDPDKGIPTRARVRFRISMSDMEGNTDTYFRAKVLVPNNPNINEEVDYDFGTYTNEESYRDLLWNNVYTVKSYIPRFSKSTKWKTERFTGIKGVNHAGYNNPIPYNNLRIRLPLMFTILCVLIKAYIWIVGIQNRVTIFTTGILNQILNVVDILNDIVNVLRKIKIPTGIKIKKWKIKITWKSIIPEFTLDNRIRNRIKSMTYTVLREGLCPDLDGWYFSPVAGNVNDTFSIKREGKGRETISIFKQTFNSIINSNKSDDDEADFDTQQLEDQYSIDEINEEENAPICLTKNIDYLVSCIEMALAEEYRVINFDFYNDWINGVIYIPRWMRTIKIKHGFLGLGRRREKIRGCMENKSIFGKTRKYMQLCSLQYAQDEATKTFTQPTNSITDNKFHKKQGKKTIKIFGKQGGLVHESTTLLGQNVYYLKPREVRKDKKQFKVNLFATDLVLLGSLNSCDMNGIPNVFEYLSITSYKLPTNLALTNMETDAPVYGNEKGTMCSTRSLPDNEQASISPIENTLEAELIYSSTKAGKDYVGDPTITEIDTSDTGMDDFDTRPLTEAAGISWDYAGPQQKINNASKNKNFSVNNMFFPGGHFLGLTCVNSQSNIKSCVNLSRICELGASMSQRQEKVRKITDDEDGNTSFHYTYNVPTGLISQDDITGEKSRAIFATMNHNRLLATKINPETGYLTYDFSYLYPYGFNGEFSTVFAEKSNVRGEYNKKIESKDEDLTAYGIAAASSRSDYDAEEYENTQMQTIEDVNVDYYRFRLGFDSADLNSDSYNQYSKFLGHSKSLDKFWLPQYENSFYFYFGLKGGATALDEFNKQFFATCSSNSLVKTSMEGLDIKISGNACEGKSNVTINLNGFELPVSVIISEKTDTGWSTLISDNSISDDSYVASLEIGKTFKIVLTDADENTMESEIVTTADFIGLDTTVNDFNLSNLSGQEKTWQRGGFVEFNNLTIGGVNGKEMGATLQLGSITSAYDEGMRIFVDSGGQYDLYIDYTCEGNTNHIFLRTITVNVPSTTDLWMGPNKEVEVTAVLGSNAYAEWWTEIPYLFRKGQYLNEWKLKHFITQQNGESESSVTFDSQVSADGDKILFGVPQSKTIKIKGQNNGWLYPNVVYKTTEEQPSGYAVTDSNQTWKVYTINNSYIYGDGNGIAATKTSLPFGAMAVDGLSVGADYCGYIDGNTGKTAPIITTSPYLQTLCGYGGIAKSIDGEIEVVKVYKDTDDTIKAIFDEEKGEPYYGIIFPIIKYPSIYRPFYINGIFVEDSSFAITRSFTAGVASINLEESFAMPIVSVGYVHNGIMMHKDEKYFFNSIAINEETKANDNEDQNKTYAEIFSAGINNVISSQTQVVSASTKVDIKEDSDADNIGEYAIEIEEGTPTEFADYAATAATPAVNTVVYDNIYYYKDNNGYKFYGEGSNDGQYYIIKNNGIVNSSSNTNVANGNSTTWAAALIRFTDGDRKGEYDLLTILSSTTDTKIVMSFENTKDNDADNPFVKEMNNVGENYLKKPQYLIRNTNIKNELANYYIELIPTCEVNANYGFSAITNTIREKPLDNRIYVNGGAVDSTYDPSDYIIVGYTKTESSSSKSTSEFLKVYNYPIEIFEAGIDGAYTVADPTEITFGSNGGSKTITIKSNQSWKAEWNGGDWLTIDKTSGAGSGTIIINADPNK